MRKGSDQSEGKTCLNLNEFAGTQGAKSIDNREQGRKGTQEERLTSLWKNGPQDRPNSEKGRKD